MQLKKNKMKLFKITILYEVNSVKDTLQYNKICRTMSDSMIGLMVFNETNNEKEISDKVFEYLNDTFKRITLRKESFKYNTQELEIKNDIVNFYTIRDN